MIVMYGLLLLAQLNFLVLFLYILIAYLLTKRFVCLLNFVLDDILSKCNRKIISQLIKSLMCCFLMNLLVIVRECVL